MDGFGGGAVQDEHRSTAVNKGPHAAASAGAQRGRRNRNFARKRPAVVGGTRQVNAPVGFAGSLAHGVPHHVDIGLVVSRNREPAVESFGVAHQVALRRKGRARSVEA